MWSLRINGSSQFVDDRMPICNSGIATAIQNILRKVGCQSAAHMYFHELSNEGRQRITQ